MTDGDRDKVITAEVIAKAWKDDAYRARLIADPESVLSEAGAKVPPGVNVMVLANSPTIANVVIPYAERWEDVEETFFAGLRKILPLPPGVELRVVQNDKENRHMVLPLSPDMGELNEEDLMAIAGGGTGANVNNAVNVNDGANVNVGGNVNAGVNANAGVDVSVVAVVAT